MQSRRRIKSAKRGRWDNSPAGLRRRKAQQDARREAIAATLPPVPDDPQPGALWQTLVVRVYVPTCPARCDQHALELDGQRIGLMAATDIGRKIAAAIHKRPSVELQADVRREVWLGANTRQHIKVNTCQVTSSHELNQPSPAIHSKKS